jgi:hypothetical protein
MTRMRLDDRQIERYSRQIVLPEVGPEGQLRLLRSRVAIAGAGPAAERAFGYLAAAGVGRLAVPAALGALADPGQTDVVVEPLEERAARGPAAPFDAAILVGEGPIPPRLARHALWIAGGRAGGAPPCPACAGARLPAAPAAPAELRTVRDALLGTVAATEAVKAILGIGARLGGRVVCHDPASARVWVEEVAPLDACAACAALAAPEG